VCECYADHERAIAAQEQEAQERDPSNRYRDPRKVAAYEEALALLRAYPSLLDVPGAQTKVAAGLMTGKRLEDRLREHDARQVAGNAIQVMRRRRQMERLAAQYLLMEQGLEEK